MLDPYRVCAALIEIVEDRYNVKIDWQISRKSDGSVITGPEDPAPANP